MRMGAMYPVVMESLLPPLLPVASSLATFPHRHFESDRTQVSLWLRVYHSPVTTPAKLVALPVPVSPFGGQILVHLCQGVLLHTSDKLLRQQGIYSHSGYT